MKIDILKEEIPFSEFFHVRRSDLRFENFDGTMSGEVTRYSFEKNDAIAVLVYHTERDAYLLVRQFRFPLVQHKIDPWMIEIVAGGIEDGEDVEMAAQREVIEETGYAPFKMEKISFFYVSPGILNERIHLFMGYIHDDSKINDGGGLKSECEDIELVWIPRKEALAWINAQNPGDAKTMIAIQWHQLKG